MMIQATEDPPPNRNFTRVLTWGPLCNRRLWISN